jgi:hypothetical protein
VRTKYLAKFQSPRAITQPKIIGLEQNVNLICNSSLYTHIPKIKSISPSIAKKKWCFGMTMRVYNHKLQINFEIHFGWMIFGQLTAVGLWNLAKYLVVTTFLCPHDEESGGHINLPLFVHPDIPVDTWFVQLSPPTVLELQLYYLVGKKLIGLGNKLQEKQRMRHCRNS